jgi:hypothetical protein
MIVSSFQPFGEQRLLRTIVQNVQVWTTPFAIIAPVSFPKADLVEKSD